MNIVESINSVLAPPHRAGYPFIIGGVVVASANGGEYRR